MSVCFCRGWYIDLISLLLSSCCFPSNSAVGGGYFAEGTICKDLNCSWGSEGCLKPPPVQGRALLGVHKAKPLKTSRIFHFKVPKTALKLVWLSVYFSPNYKSIQIPIEKSLFEKAAGENM